MSKHTPAPWHVENSGGTVASGLKRICTLENIPLRISPEVDANAHLIAAAPDMYAALKALFEHCAMVHKHWGEGSNQKQADEAIKAAQAAIQKAEGE